MAIRRIRPASTMLCTRTAYARRFSWQTAVCAASWYRRITHAGIHQAAVPALLTAALESP